MCRYIFALFLLNFSYHSLGDPIPPKPPVLLMNLLTTLADSCENKFLSDQIKTQLKNCAEMASLPKDKLKCFLFYDISKQLCSSAITNSKLARVDDYAAQINERQDVNLLCESANNWVFSNLTEYPHYKHTAETIFKYTSRCLKMCSVEDLLSDDANFYCKYFRWGTDFLKEQSLGLSPTQVEAAQVLPETGNIEKKPLELDNALPDKDVQIRNITTTGAVNTPSEAASVRIVEIPETEVVKPETSSNNNPEAEPSSGNSALFEKSKLKPDDREEPIPVAEDPLAIIQADKPANTTNKYQKPDSPDTTLLKPESEITKKSDVAKEIVNFNDELNHKEKAVLETPVDPGLSKPKPASDAEDYQDTEEGNGDIDVNDAGEDPVSIDVNKINKLDQPKEEEETPKRKTIYSDIKGESSIYPSFGQDGYTGEDDDDHFFSFFLTAVIMVALIYILYHNKNKVGKVFFGLILEGRQTGRRRDSRGHAYRRLDTLEQAMSTNSAAPPSKIIY